MIVKAIYKNGVFEPLEHLSLENGAQVEVEIVQLEPQSTMEPSPFAALRGIWGHLSANKINEMEQALQNVRQMTATKLERLASELSDTLGK